MQQTAETSKIITIDPPKDVQIESVVSYWRQYIGTPTPQVRAMARIWLDTLTDFDIFYAIEETAIAPNPSIRYCTAILRRLKAEKTDKKP